MLFFFVIKRVRRGGDTKRGVSIDISVEIGKEDHEHEKERTEKSKSIVEN